MSVQSYRDLIVWQKSMTFVGLVYARMQSFPKEESYGHTNQNQIRRAAASIPSNMTEGQARTGSAEFRNLLSIARGSAAEVET
jgi:four helix bundle protein